MTLLREATLDDLSTLLEFEKRLIEYERDFTPNLKKSDFNYYNLKSYIKDPEISVVVAEEKNKIIASGYALIKENKTYKIPDKFLVSSKFEFYENKDQLLEYCVRNGVQIFTICNWFENELNCLPVNFLEYDNFLFTKNYLKEKDFEFKLKML